MERKKVQKFGSPAGWPVPIPGQSERWQESKDHSQGVHFLLWITQMWAIPYSQFPTVGNGLLLKEASEHHVLPPYWKRQGSRSRFGDQRINDSLKLKFVSGYKFYFIFPWIFYVSLTQTTINLPWRLNILTACSPSINWPASSIKYSILSKIVIIYLNFQWSQVI